MNLDELHKVMKGDMTIDQACEGMTDDFEIGHVSHRKDGDYRKVAQGKWVPVKAGGQGQMGAGEKASEKPASGIEAWKKDEGVAGRDLYTSPDGQHKIRVNRNYLAGRRTFTLGTKENGKWERKGEFDTIEEAVAAAKPAEQKGEPAVRNVDHALRVIENSGGKIKGWAGWDDGFVVETENKTYQFKKGPEGYTQTDATMSLEEAKAKERQEHNAKGEQQGGDNTELSISEETGRDKFMDKLTTFSEKYNDPSKVTVWKTEKGNWDTYYDGHRLGIIGGDQINDDLAKKLGWYQGNYANDAAAPRLTRDTKIRLSRIKREQTQDKTYNVGETSQRKDGLYKKVAPGKWAPVKAGGIASAPAGGNGRTDGGLVWRSPDDKHRIHEDNSSGKTKYTLYELGDNYSRIIGEYDSPEAAVAAGEKINAPAGGKAEVNPITGKPLRPDVVAYANQKKAEAEQKRNTEKTAGGFTLAQNDKIKNAATDVIFKRRGEKLTPADLQREYKMSEPEANEASRRINEYFSGLEKDRQEFAKAGEKKAQNAKPQASPMAGTKKTYEGSGSTKGHKWEAEKVGDKYISTHTWPDGRTDKTEITQKDYETMRTTQGGKSEAPKPASSKPSSELKYYEDMGDRVEELRSQMTTAGPEEKRRLIRESVDLQRRMQTAPFRPKKKR